ncbi:hypothetical protein BDR04DRAFT_1008411, partial [Suillus decipiens]
IDREDTIFQYDNDPKHISQLVLQLYMPLYIFPIIVLLCLCLCHDCLVYH